MTHDCPLTKARPSFNGFTVDEPLVTTRSYDSSHWLSDGGRLHTGLHGSNTHIHKVMGWLHVTVDRMGGFNVLCEDSHTSTYWNPDPLDFINLKL